MPLFLLKFRLLECMREDCMTLFGGMTTEDDRKDAGPDVEVLGRWSTLGEGSGFCICRASTSVALGTWLSKWITMATMTVTPVVDDNQAREIVLGREPEYRLDYADVGREPQDDESLYVIEYAFLDGAKSKGLDMFARMGGEEDKEDAGRNVPLGRWHDLASGTGMAVCASYSETDLQSWAFRWRDMCNCRITPVLTDAQFRKIAQGRPGFESKRAALLEKMHPTKRRAWF